MSIFHNNALIGSSGQGGYLIERSLRFNSADSAYLSRTPASAGNRKTWTWAGWVKRSSISGGIQNLFMAGSSGTEFFVFQISNDTLSVQGISGGTEYIRLLSAQVMRDPSAWYHLVITLDLFNATQADRCRIYINGTRVSTFSTNINILTSSQSFQINNNVTHAIGRNTISSGTYPDLYLADIHFIDGQALDHTSFGEPDNNGIWQPIRYTGTYGTNGFHLDFSDNSAATAAALGADSSGNGNNWTPILFSVAAGAGNDSFVDVPTNGTQTDTGVGGEVRGNYCTINPLRPSSAVLSNGNLEVTVTGSDSAASSCSSTFKIPSSGKWYYEITIDTISSASIGLISDASWTSNRAALLKLSSGAILKNGSVETSISAQTAGTFGIAVNKDADTVAWYKNGSLLYTLSSANIVDTASPGLEQTSSVGTASGIFNFGQRPFAHPAPSGFKALCTTNLPPPTIEDGSTVMDVVTYTGNGSNQTISGLNFSPDFVWGKIRNGGGGNHMLADIVRGATKRLISNLTNAEDTGSALVSFDSNGFSLDSGSGINQNTDQIVAWTWDAGDNTVTNNDGSISSQVRANPSAGFSIVTYTSNGLNGISVGHGLGVKPALVIQKDRTAASDWLVLTQLIDGSNDYLLLNSTAAAAPAAAGMTSTTFGSWDRTNGNSMVAYCFAAVAGYSAFGSYTGNGSADGPFVYTGFRPKWVMIKRTDSTQNWPIVDSSRDSYNIANRRLFSNLSSAEDQGISNYLDLVSNGFKCKDSNISYNASGGTYIYAAFAENPFKLARAR